MNIKKIFLGSIARYVTLLLVMLLSTATLYAASSTKFVDSDDYKSKDFKKGILIDYRDLQKGDDIEWVWIAPGVSLGDHAVAIQGVEDNSGELTKSQLNGIKDVFNEYMEKLKGKRGTVKAEIAVYEIQKYAPGKAWIPFVGGHQMQAGIGVEMLVSDKSGKPVAKFRHFAREGMAVEAAAQEAAEDLYKYLSKH